MKKLSVFLAVFAGLIFFYTSSHADDCTRGKEYFTKAMAQEDLNMAIKYLKMSNKFCHDFNVSYNLGMGYLKLDQPENALAWFEDASKIAASNKALGAVRGRMAQAKIKQNRFAEGIADLQAAMKIHPDPPLWMKSELKSVELAQSEQIVPAAEINRGLATAMASARNFGTAPSINIRVRFDTDSYLLTPAAMEQVKELGMALSKKNYKNKSILLVGHADRRGDEDENLILSQNRAKSVYQALLKSFPNLADTLGHTGKGETCLLYEGDTDTDHRLNRRVEVRVK